MFESDTALAPSEDQRVAAMRRFADLTDRIDNYQDEAFKIDALISEARSEREQVRQYLRDVILTPSEMQQSATVGTPTGRF